MASNRHNERAASSCGAGQRPGSPRGPVRALALWLAAAPVFGGGAPAAQQPATGTDEIQTSQIARSLLWER